MAEIGRVTGVSKQNIHHFISNSPWSGEAVVSVWEALGSLFEGDALILELRPE